MPSPFDSPLLLATGGTKSVITTDAGSKRFSRGDSTITPYDSSVASVGTSTSIPDNFGAGVPYTSSFGGPVRTATRGSTNFQGTISVWFKRGDVSYASTLVSFWERTGAGQNYLQEFRVGFNATGNIVIDQYRPMGTGTTPFLRTYYVTTATFRDKTAWYHLVLATNWSDPTPSERLKLYINGQRITQFTTASHYGTIGGDVTGTFTSMFLGNTISGTTISAPTFTRYDGLMTEFYFSQSQNRTPADFARTYPELYNMWLPKKVPYNNPITYLYHFPFKTSTTDITTGTVTWASGPEASWGSGIFGGNTQDQSDDIPGFGINNKSNYCVFIGGDSLYGSGAEVPDVYSGGERVKPASIVSTGQWGTAIGSQCLFTGKWYFEVTWLSGPSAEVDSSSRNIIIGAILVHKMDDRAYGSNYVGTYAQSWGFRFGNSTKTPQLLNDNGQSLSDGDPIAFLLPANLKSVAPGDVIGCALDVDNGKIWWSKNGTWLNGDPVLGTLNIPAHNAVISYSNLSSQPEGKGLLPAISLYATNTTQKSNIFRANFGQRGFIYGPPSGYSSVCTSNLPELLYEPDQCVQVVTRTGTGTFPQYFTTASTNSLPAWTTGTNPFKLACTSDGRYVYCTNNGSSNITVRDLVTKTTSTISSTYVGANPTGIAITADDQYVVVAFPGQVRFINRASPSIVANYTLGTGGGNPTDLVVSSDGKFVYAIAESGNLYIIDLITFGLINGSPGNGMSVISTGALNLRDIAITPNNKYVYFTSPSALVEYAVETQSVRTLSLGGSLDNPRGVTVSKDGLYVYVTSDNIDNGDRRIVQFNVGGSGLAGSYRNLRLAPNIGSEAVFRSVATACGDDYLICGSDTLGGYLSIYDLTNLEPTDGEGATVTSPIENGNSNLGNNITDILVLPDSVNNVIPGNERFTRVVYTDQAANTIYTAHINSYVNSNFEPAFIWTKARTATTGWNYANVGNSSKSITNGKAVYTGISSGNTAGLPQQGKNIGILFNNKEKKYYIRQTTLANLGNITNLASNNYVDFIFSSKIASFQLYTGTGADGLQIPHTLGVVPGFASTKKFTDAGADEYWVYLRSRNYTGISNRTFVLNQPIYSNNDLYPDGTAATTSTNVIINNDSNIQVSGGIGGCLALAYLPGIITCDAYSGNGNANGAYVWTGFKPRFLLIKRTDVFDTNTGTWTGQYPWKLIDSQRSPSNPRTLCVEPSNSDIETVAQISVDFYAQGFKFRISQPHINAATTGSNYNFIAIAETPFKYCLGQ